MSSELRDVASTADNRLEDYKVDAEMRMNVYQARMHDQANTIAAGEVLSVEESRLMAEMLIDGHRAGLALSEARREVLTNKKKHLSQKCVEFERNANEENGFVSFISEELNGLPQISIAGYTKHEGVDIYDVTYKAPDAAPIRNFAISPETRKRIHISALNFCN